MTITTQRRLWCNRPDCFTSLLGAAAGENAVALRVRASRSGWTRRHGQDFCPTHSKNSQKGANR